MALIFTGRSALATLAASGQGALGLPTEVDLSVDAAEDLAVDPQDALQVASAVTWSGASAARTVEA